MLIMCTHSGTHKNNCYICTNIESMVFVSSREFRANQRKYFDLAKSNTVVITSRSHGNYRLVPISDSDMIVDDAALQAKINRGIAEYEQGKVTAIAEGESMLDFLNRMIAE